MSLSCHDLDLSAFEQSADIAVGVSGGPDSMALAWLLKEWAAPRGITLHVLSVDHGLRADSAAEVHMVAQAVQHWPQTKHYVLAWAGDKPDTRLLEEARRARYDLMHDYCRDQGILYLFVAHHQDDQAETFLMRLAKGSGVDGLGGMQRMQQRGDITLVRPLLHIPKQALMDICQTQGLSYINDPTNEMRDYMRPRLRAAQAVLAEEGLSAKRLATTAMRMARARRALEHMAQQAYTQSLQTEDKHCVTFKLDTLCACPEEIVLRVIQRAMAQVSGSSDPYPPRLEKVEELVDALIAGRLVKTTTLGGCLFVPDVKNGLLSIQTES